MSYVMHLHSQHSEFIGNTFDLWDRRVYTEDERDQLLKEISQVEGSM